MRRLIGILLLVLAAAGSGPAAAADTVFRWRPLALEDFRGPVPPRNQRMRGEAFEAAVAHTRIEREVGFEIAADGRISITRMSFAAFFDPSQAWMDRQGLSPESVAALLRHEQGHFDISEATARALNAAAPRIRREIETAINTDPAKRQRILELGREIARLDGQPAERQRLSGERLVLLESGAPMLGALFREHDRRQEDYDRETGHGRNRAVQAEWEEAIRRSLQQPPSR